MRESERTAEQEKLFVRTGFDIEKDGRIWKVSMFDIADGRGLTTQLDDHIVYLDWHDIMVVPGVVRMHLYPGKESRIPYDEKLGRMETWVAAIDLYEGMMADHGERLSKVEIERLLAEHKLPKPKTVVLDTGTAGLRKLFKELGFEEGEEKPHPFLAPWDKLVDLARSGELLEAWKKLKGK